jgi:hypothetical protein
MGMDTAVMRNTIAARTNPIPPNTARNGKLS